MILSLAVALPVMKANFPDAPVIKTAAGHFLQEEVPLEIAGGYPACICENASRRFDNITFRSELREVNVM